ncbi:MAG: SH3 domain-containing protein [Anaerolineaceae bacterium]|nr:MAG: SH3 domain-containing protein [Anaerolineaceae bacterium]
MLAAVLTSGLLAALLIASAPTVVRAQGIVSCAASGSALGETYVTVNSDQAQVNVRSGPNSYLYGKIGILLTFESAPALGRSPGGDWIQVSCPAASGGSGWVYAANVTLTATGELPVVDIPATATPLFTSTVDPVLAAEFPPVQPTSTRLPTFTPAAPPSLPVFTDTPALSPNGNLQGALIFVIGVLGLAVLLLSFVFKR